MDQRFRFFERFKNRAQNVLGLFLAWARSTRLWDAMSSPRASCACALPRSVGHRGWVGLAAVLPWRAGVPFRRRAAALLLKHGPVPWPPCRSNTCPSHPAVSRRSTAATATVASTFAASRRDAAAAVMSLLYACCIALPSLGLVGGRGRARHRRFAI